MYSRVIQKPMEKIRSFKNDLYNPELCYAGRRYSLEKMSAKLVDIYYLRKLTEVSVLLYMSFMLSCMYK